VPELADAPPPDQEPSPRGLTLLNLAAGMLLLAAVAATGYWSFTQPPATIPTSTAPKGGVADGGLLALPSTTTPVPPTAERQALEAEFAKAEARPTEPAAAPVPSATAPAALEEVVDRVMPAVVLVETSSGRGSAFYVRPDTLITNVHVVKEDGFVKLRRTDGSTTSARVELRAPAFDIAILRVSTPAADQVVIPLGTARTLRAGQEVFTIGSPFGTLRNSVTRGIVSGLRVSGAATMVQNDAAANPGNSGGPLLDRNGLAIGVTTASSTDKPGISYAVAIDHAMVDWPIPPRRRWPSAT
jgi:S1-C subfamily serine protease